MRLSKAIFAVSQLALALILLSGGCTYDGAWVENEGPLVQAPSEMAMPVELFEQNLGTTSYTALVHVTRGRVLGKVAWPFNRLGPLYRNHLYEADVLETFKGAAHDRVVYSVMAEAGTALNLPNYPVVVSLCGAGGNSYYVPDNGYVSAASHRLVEAGRRYREGSRAAREGRTGSESRVGLDGRVGSESRVGSDGRVGSESRGGSDGRVGSDGRAVEDVCQ